ncbi:alpha/beta fold hydrolase [Shewanella sp. WXL01]|uniref:Alpha/beta fold hydrolase n=1 Tax=Shewanella maritima TaxID=2520507 RepID=A0A411PMA3_9GAMM|nr:MULTISPECIES: alpha/beta fold hydrolase [Shewanella]NKF51441.1 alpha/beta fold hydrolase [Shewanella sp. WXL01]QBF84629.1 alpha/beta fold hydrolase [Shewanella maritima]
MHYETRGQGQPVILIHGLFGNIDNLKNLAISLESDFQVTRVDVPNHGLSTHWQHMDYVNLASAFIELLDSLNIEKANFVGHSMGGKIAMAIALLHPKRVSGLVVADIAPVAYQPRHDDVFRALNSLNLSDTDRKRALAHMLEHNIDEGTAQFLLKNLQRSDGGFKWKMNLTGLQQSYPDIIGWPFTKQSQLPWQPFQLPCLFVRGGDSNYVTAEHRQEIIEQFPKVAAKTLNGTGHWLHAQKPEIFNRIVKDFLVQNQSN